MGTARTVARRSPPTSMVLQGIEAVRLRPMSRRIDIELTSALPDDSWTWRAAGAKQPKGTLDGSILDPGAAVGDVIKVEIDQEIDGITVRSVVGGRPTDVRPGESTRIET